MRTVVLILCYFTFLCNTKGQDYPSHSNYRLYRHFWFEDGIETDKMLARQVINDRSTFSQENQGSWLRFNECSTANGFDEYVDSDSIYRMDVNRSSHGDVVHRFMLSLEMYNLWFKFKKNRGTVDNVVIELFIDGKLKKQYQSDWVENGVSYGRITLKALSTISGYNFGHLVYPIFKEDACTIYFPFSKATIQCSRKFYEEVLFPKYLNYISKEHRLTWYQIGVQKVDWNSEKSN